MADVAHEISLEVADGSEYLARYEVAIDLADP
jgi:hypothetical protein